MKVAIIGAGKTGFALAVHLLNKDYEVVVYSRDSQKVNFFANKKIKVTGCLEGKYKITTTNDLSLAIKDANVVFVTTWANAHNDVIKKISVLLSYQQSILFLNGNWGALEALSYLGKNKIDELDLEVGETSGMPYVANFKDREHLEIKKIKKLITLSTFNSKVNVSKKVLNLFESLYMNIEIAQNIIATSLMALNPIIHVPVILFNLARIEKQENFSILVEGLTPGVANFIMKVDSERKLLAEKLDIPYTNIITQLSEQWGEQFPDLPTLFSTLETYKNLQAPKSLNSRFIVEDLPFGIDPLVKLGMELNVKVEDTKLLSIFTHVVTNEKLKSDLSFINKENIKLAMK